MYKSVTKTETTGEYPHPNVTCLHVYAFRITSFNIRNSFRILVTSFLRTRLTNMVVYNFRVTVSFYQLHYLFSIQVWNSHRSMYSITANSIGLLKPIQILESTRFSSVTLALETLHSLINMYLVYHSRKFNWLKK